MTKQRYSLRSILRKALTALLVVFATVRSAAPAVAQDPRAPEAVGAIPAQTIAAGQSASLDLTTSFADADGEQLAYAATVSDVAIATVSVSGTILAIEGVTPGTVVVTVFASDPGGLSATQRIQVTVEAPNRTPEPVGTIPGQSLGPGQWVSISLTSFFRDPEGEALSFSATTSNAAVASVAVSGDIVTITQAGAGTATVTTVARDPGGLSVEQSITVAARSDGVTPTPAQQTQPGGPAVPETGPRQLRAAGARQPAPFPPRLLAGFVESTGYTLLQGRGHVSAGYLGASPVAQIGEFGDVLPGVGQASYGVTDDLTVTAGTGFFYNRLTRDSDLFPYFAPKYRAWNNEQISVAVGGYLGILLAEGDLTYYAGSVASSIAVNDDLTLHASGGMLGISATLFGETHTEQFGVFAVGGDFDVTPELGLAGEFRRIGIEDGGNVVTGSLRFVGTVIAGEAGLAYHLEPDADFGPVEIRPIFSVAFRF